MQKRVVVVVIVVVALANAACGGKLLNTGVPAIEAALATAPVDVDDGASFVVEPPIAQYVHELDQRERREQIRDWAVLGTVAHLGATPEQAAAATYELPPARLPHLGELYELEYGRGRRAYLGDRVLLFRDGDDPDPQATIGRLADRVRMENGELPATVEVYLVHDRRNDGEIRVQRVADVTREALFSADYGYVEGEGGDMTKLATWLARVDDLSFAQLGDDGRLVLGGRRFSRTRTAGLTVEDVAALYQAHEQLDAPYAKARALLTALPSAAQGAVAHLAELWEAGTLTDEAARPDLLALVGSVSSSDQLRELVNAAHAVKGSSRSPGFSLDPEWLPSPLDPQRPVLRDALRAFAADPCGDLRAIAMQAAMLVAREPDPTRRTWRATLAADLQGASAMTESLCAEIKRRFGPEVLAVTEALDQAGPSEWDTALVPYFELRARLQDAELAGAITGAVLEFHEADSRVQCARYEGLAGTQVGMTLFYTDLLAKLWQSTDYGLSAPILEVPGFLTKPRVDLPASYREEMKRMLGTRIWFGPRANGASRVTIPRGSSFAFEHRFSRIYAAGNSPMRPGLEEQPSEDSRRTLGWWDRHFDEVADYEPQYHRQNQVMKWSLVTAALTDAPVARYLHDIGVPRSVKFRDWQRANRAQLRFSESLPVVHATIPGKECIPIIASYAFHSAGTVRYIAGGVSTAARLAPRATPTINAAKPLGARKPFAADLGGGTAGNATRAHPTLEGTSVTFRDVPAARTTRPAGGGKLGTPRVTYERGAAPDTLVIKSGNGNTAVGELRLVPMPGQSSMKLRWANDAVGPGRKQAPVGGLTVKDADAAARGGHVIEAARAYEQIVVKPVSANDFARKAVVDSAAARPSKLLQDLRQLEAQPASISAPARKAVGAAVKKWESPAVARRVDAMLERGAPLNGNHEVVSVVKGKVAVTRDITMMEMPAIRRAAPTDLSDAPVYIDGRVRTAHEGFLPDTGGSAARWRRVRGVRIHELNASKIGALPDRLRLSDGQIFERANPATVPPAKAGAHVMTPKIYLIRQCDVEHKTKTTGDDC
jgi:hypothetical protein